ncbi:amidohydrolase, partial [Bacillus toyonensis]
NAVAMGAVPGRAFAAGHAPVEVAYVNAAVWTGAGPDVRSDAIGVAGGHIVAIGREAVGARSGPRTRVIDLGGAFVTPG